MQTNFKSDMPTRYDTRKAKQLSSEREQRDVYRLVALRDRCHCRVCGTYCHPDIADQLKRGHRHHIAYRSAGGGTSTANLCLLCPACHNAEHKHQIRIEGNADEALTISKRDEYGHWYVSVQETAPGQVERD
jgi:Restriction endonuclease